ncbi:MAG: transposase, partial [Bryobacteraceae bacterium]
AVGVPHHVTQRGNGRQDVFFTERDREAYLDALFDYAARYGMRVWGYCLMRNHVHLVVVPEAERSLAQVFGRTHSDYARYANVARRSCGHLWQARFYSCALDQAHVWAALAYVERNPETRCVPGWWRRRRNIDGQRRRRIAGRTPLAGGWI